MFSVRCDEHDFHCSQMRSFALFASPRLRRRSCDEPEHLEMFDSSSSSLALMLEITWALNR